MLRWIGPVSLGVIGLLLYGCAGKKSETNSPSASEMDLREVTGKEPPLFVMQFPNLQRDWPAIASLIPPESEMAPLKEVPLDVLVPAMTGQAIGQFIDLGTRAEVGFFADSISAADESATVIAVVLNDTSEALHAMEREFVLAASEGGAIRLTPRPELEASLFAEDPPVCEVWGKGRGVLTCGSSLDYSSGRGAEMVKHLLGAVSVEETDTAVFEIPAATFGQFVHEEQVGTSPAELLGKELVQGFLRDLEVGRFGLVLSSEKPLFAIDLTFASRDSVFTSTLLDAARPLSPDPEFFRLPEDTDFALQFAGMPRGHRSGDVEAMIRAVVDTSVDETGVGKAGVEPLTESARQLFLTGGPSILATGMDEDAYREGLTKFLRKTSVTGDDVVALQKSAASWTLVGLKEPAEQWLAGAFQLFELDVKYSNLGKPEKVTKTIRTGKERLANAEPILGQPSRSILYAASPSPGAPQGSAHYVAVDLVNPEFENQAGPGGLPPAPSEEHVLLSGVGDYTWICVSQHEEICVEKLNTVSRGSNGSWEKHPLRQRLSKEESHLSGITSINGFTTLFLEDSTIDQLREAHQELSALQARPEAASRPLIVRGSSLEAPGAARKLRLEAELGREELLIVTTMMASD